MKANYSHQIRAQFLSRKSRRSEYQNLIKSSFHRPSRFSCTRDPRGLQTRQEGCKGESGYTSREESYFKPHSSSNPERQPGAGGSRSPGAQAAHFSRVCGDYHLQPAKHAPPHRRWGLTAPAGTRRPRPRRRPPAPTAGSRPPRSPRSAPAAAAHVSARPSASFLTLRLPEETEPLFNGLGAHIPSPCQAG